MDSAAYLDPENIGGVDLYAYCGNNPVMYVDPTGNFFISTAVLIGVIVGSIAGSIVGGVIAFNVAKNSGAEGWELAGWTLLGILTGTLVGAAIGAAVGYGVGYLAGGTYANGLVAKSVGKGVNTFLSQTNKIHHALSKTSHNLSGYTAKTLGKLMKTTLKKGIINAYKTVQSAYWTVAGSEVTFIIIEGAIKISDIWIR